MSRKGSTVPATSDHSCRIRSHGSELSPKFINMVMKAARSRSPSASSTARSTRSRRRRTPSRSKLFEKALEQRRAGGRSEVAAASAAPPTRCRSKCVRAAACALAMRWLHRRRAQARREVDGRAAGRRADGSLRRSRRRDQEARRNAPHGRSQQGLRPLPLVSQ